MKSSSIRLQGLWKSIVGGLAIMLVLSGCATNGGKESKVAVPWRMYDTGSVVQPAQGHAGLYVYRPAEISSTPWGANLAINLHVNGAYAASLLPGAWTYVEICPSAQGVQLSADPVVTRDAISAGPATTTTVKAGEQAYYRIAVNADKSMILEVATENEVTRLIDPAHPAKAAHTISRVPVQACGS